MIAVLHHLHLSTMHSNLITMLYTTCLTGEWRRMAEDASSLPRAPPVQHVSRVSEEVHIKALIHLLEDLHMNCTQEKQYF